MKEFATLRTIAENRRLVSEMGSSFRDLDQLWAAPKDAAAQLNSQEASADFECEDEHLKAEAGGEGEARLILIVDDDQDDFVLLERALKRVEAVALVSWAQEGGEALEALDRFSLEFASICVVVDIQLPDMDAFELVEAIRARQLPNRMRFVFVTGNPNPHLRSRAQDYGADGFFVKPCRHAGFLAIARQIDALCAEPAKAA